MHAHTALDAFLLPSRMKWQGMNLFCGQHRTCSHVQQELDTKRKDSIQCVCAASHEAGSTQECEVCDSSFEEKVVGTKRDPLIAKAPSAIPEKVEDCAHEPARIDMQSIEDFAHDKTQFCGLTTRLSVFLKEGLSQ